MAPSPYIFIISIGSVDMNKYARFDEIPSMTLKDIKETKRYGRTYARKDGKQYTRIIKDIETRDSTGILSMQQTTKVVIILHGSTD